MIADVSETSVVISTECNDGTDDIMISIPKRYIHILRKHIYSIELNLTSKFFTKTGFFRQNIRITFSTLLFDEIFMLKFEIFTT